ncbi:MAG TPA: efflux RND transporter periplasmic adaptor subunit [Thermoanaerobaculia bacterium]|jgi:multidrug efflux pump subunit AcrA (membrane-fusion protein)|nr:efflux RND transporter periplasmic adaptor subunit [Thermoanaerobaculia bacterium]
MRPVLIAGAVAILLALAAFLPWPGGSSAGDVPVLHVASENFERRVPAQGNLQAVTATPISVPTGVPGPFRIGWVATDGSRVKQGDVVIRFDPSAIEKRLVDAGDDLRENRLAMEKKQIEGTAELRKLEKDAAMARIELADAKQFQKKDSLIFSRADIIESEIDQGLAEEREGHAQATRQTRQKLSGTEAALLQIKIRQADAKISQARAALQALTVTAPHDGVLILKRNWRGESTRVGDNVWNGQPLAEIPDLARMQAEVYVLEADAGGLTPGRQALVTVESAPGVTWPAKIARVDALAKPRILGSPVQYFAVTLALDRTDPQVMKPGQRVRATLFLEQRKGALLVPRQALFDREGRTVVYRRDLKSRGGTGGNGFAPVEVKLGPSSLGRVVVESGLHAGDVLAMRDPTRPAGAPPEKKDTAHKAPPVSSHRRGGGIVIISQ